MQTRIYQTEQTKPGPGQFSPDFSVADEATRSDYINQTKPEKNVTAVLS